MSLSDNFYHEFTKYRNSLRLKIISDKKAYDEMLQFLELDRLMTRLKEINWPAMPLGAAGENFFIIYVILTILWPFLCHALKIRQKSDSLAEIRHFLFSQI